MGRTAGYSKKNHNYRTDSYIEGSAVRKQHVQSNTAPKRVPQKAVRHAVSRKTRRNREKALQINVIYVAFLFVVAVVMLCVCVRFLRLRAESTAYRKTVASLESQVSIAKMENDVAYEEVISSVDLEGIKSIAINKLGMVYADQGQVITYNSQDSDYVRQYSEVPKE